MKTRKERTTSSKQTRSMNPKQERQDYLLELIKTHVIGNQEELGAYLEQAGFRMTQATISRDLRDLNILKVTLSDGRQRYVSLDGKADYVGRRLMAVFSQAVIDMRVAENLLIIKTLPGMANATAASLDAMSYDEILGTVAGDDTIFVATESKEACKTLRSALMLFVSDEVKEGWNHDA